FDEMLSFFLCINKEIVMLRVTDRFKKFRRNDGRLGNFFFRSSREQPFIYFSGNNNKLAFLYRRGVQRFAYHLLRQPAELELGEKITQYVLVRFLHDELFFLERDGHIGD